MNRTHVTKPLVAALAVVAGCQTTYEVPDDPVGAIGKAALTVFDGDGRLKDPFGDADGDGISNRDELEGWVITVDPNGYATLANGDNRWEEALEKRTVSSDPRWADTDGDGLTDGQERQFKCDPRRADTDGDTIFDAEEVRRFGTSPSSVDTDGDARGGNGLLPPLFQLFDGGELRLVPDPANPTSSERVVGRGATSPFLADSDGDGVGDYEESLASLRRPTVAEIPKLRVFPTPGAVLDMYLNSTSASGVESSSTYGSSTVISEAGSIRNTTSIGLAIEHSTYAEAFASAEGSGGCCQDIAGGASSFGASVENTLTMSQSISTTFESSFSVNANHIRNQALAAAQSQEVTLTGGTLRTSIDLVNDGPVTVTVKNLTVGAGRYDRVTGKYVPVGELTTRGSFTLAPRERRTVFLDNGDIPLQAMLDLFADASNLMFSPSRYDLKDQDGADFDFALADVRNNTASIEIDDSLASDKYWVAANIDPERGTTIGRMLEELGLDFAAEPADVDGTPGVDGWKVRIGQRETEFWTGAPPDLGDTLPYTSSGGPGARVVKRGWFGFVKRFDEDTGGTFYDNLFEAPVFPGDAVVLVYSEDMDRDGLSAAEERIAGSSDLTPVSDATLERPDGDGLSDFWEVREGWTVTWSGHAPYRVFPSPAAIDTDGDGLSDDEEAQMTMTDPWLVDTDQDSRSDFFEAEDVKYGLDPLEQQLALPGPSVRCRLEANTAQDGDRYFVLRASASAPGGDVATITLHFLDLDAFSTSGPGAPIDVEGTRWFEHTRVFDFCPDPTRFTASATNGLGSSTEVACTWRQVVMGNIIDVDDCGVDPTQTHGPEWWAYRYE